MKGICMQSPSPRKMSSGMVSLSDSSRFMRHVKKKHQVPVYQWYTPSHTSSVPGLNYPNLKADGMDGG